MVAKIKSGKSLIGAINYNEYKVKAGKAVLLAAQSYSKDMNLLTFYDKLFRLTDLANRNQRTKTNTVHLSLNFDLTENLDQQTLIELSDRYMAKIGFGEQPYLIYKHTDAGHPHIHIVTTNIEADGNRISLHNIGHLKSEPARKEIEKEFGLVEAESKNSLKKQLDPAPIFPLIYGETDTKRAITNIVNAIIQQYKFSSLTEFNAVLRLYNVEADSGNKASTMYRKQGLRYWPLDKAGKKLGVPIKASSIYRKPTQSLLNDCFRLGEYLRRPLKEQLRHKINNASTTSNSKDQLLSQLKKLEVTGIFHENAEGRIYGVTFIDHQNKAVFKGSDLGEKYCAAALIAALHANTQRTAGAWGNYKTDNEVQNIGSVDSTNHSPSIIAQLLSPTDQSGSENLFERKKRKKKRKLNL